MMRPLLLALLAAAPLHAEVPRVVTDIPPVQGLVASVMGGLGAPDLLVPAGASPHHFALKPSDARALQNADLVVRVGEALTPGIGKSIAALSAGATVLDLSGLPGTLALDMREEAVFAGADAAQDGGDDHGGHGGHDDHDDHAGQDHAAQDDHDDHGHDDHGHHHDGLDPHMWLAPQNARLWLTAIAEALAEADPENAATYRANAATAGAEIDAAMARARARLEPLAGSRFVVFHDAYQYLERSLGLTVLGAVQMSDATAPSPARLAALRDAIAATGADCVFAEPQFDPRLIAAVSEGTGIRVAELDPLGSALSAGAAFYPALIDDLSGRIAACAAP